MWCVAGHKGCIGHVSTQSETLHTIFGSGFYTSKHYLENSSK